MLNIVLFEPEIPFNTANIIRTCVGGNMNLHLIKPLGFDLEKEHPDLKRGSTNFLNDVNLTLHENFDEFEKFKGEAPLYILTRYGKKIYSEINYSDNTKDIYVLFGKESTGVTKKILDKYISNSFRIPMTQKMRSLNLSNCVALVSFELLRQNNFENLEFEEPIKH